MRLLIGVVCALVMLGGGRLLERAVLGPDDAVTRTRAEADVQTRVDAMSLRLRAIAIDVSDAPALEAATAGDVPAARRLFDAASSALARGEDGDFAVTIYAADGTPLAWAGRPSELTADRLAGGDVWFLAQGPRGLRLVYVAPVLNARQQRSGTVAAERAVGTTLPTWFAAAAIGPPVQHGGAVRVPGTVTVTAPSRQPLLTARFDPAALARTRTRWRRATLSMTLLTLALTLLVLTGRVLDWRLTARPAHQVSALVVTALLVAAVRTLLHIGSPTTWSEAPLFSASVYTSSLLRGLLTSPFDFLLTALTAGTLVVLLLFAGEAWRTDRQHRRRAIAGTGRVAAFIGAQLAAGAGVAAILAGHQALLRDTIANTTLDLLHFSLHPWDTPRFALQAGLVVWHASALALAVLLLRLGHIGWRSPRHGWRVRAVMVVSWALPLVVWRLGDGWAPRDDLPLLVAWGVAATVAVCTGRLQGRYRHGSQAFRLTMMTLGLIVPALACYPAFFERAWQAKVQLVETRYAAQAVNQRATIQTLLQDGLSQIDRIPDLAGLVAGTSGSSEAQTDGAFRAWRATSLSTYPVTSSVELYGPTGALVSRFAFNLPEDLAAAPRSEESTCDWEAYEEVAPFFAEERRSLHAGRALCTPDGRILGSIVVHAMLDYANLPFIASQSPYVELLRPTDPLRGEGISGRDVEFAFYGWSRRPLYSSSGRAWPINDTAFARIEASRTPLWLRLQRGDVAFDAYTLNDRGGIYVLAVPVVGPLGHLVNLAELTVLAGLTYLLLLVASVLFRKVSRRARSGPSLLREMRASFYRKLFLAFVAATVVPVVALAVATGTYIADQMRSDVEQEAVRTASAARRVVEDLVAPRAAQQGIGIDDNLMVWVSRLIDQDVNIFRGPRLLATSERNLFASGLLPARTTAEVYRDIVLHNDATSVTREQIGGLEYLVAATSMTAHQINAILTVPLTSRQLEIELQIDTLYRQVLLGALIFVFCGAGLGYWLAERIADPVNRLTRATRRLSRGDLDVRVAATSSDEFRRLVDDFNRMAAELKRQRTELERTHRLEAWAEMARQVAHEIKNPLTPIQLNAEHLRRVHADRGEPLGPVLQECVATILQQVTLLRQIASEFSNFASSPAVRPTRVDLRQLLGDILAPYRQGLVGRMTFAVDVPENLPDTFADRTLVTRALTNIVENALHAMPEYGTVTVVARSDGPTLTVRVSDTGIGMDAEALARAFEPYFSTKATGTGLGLPIAKRNVEVNGGTLTITSEPGQGTTVEMTLPSA